ncbi:hypothetical protein COLO4_37456 [Corchorus olitorius]|uniref:Uncharacterized protein n=1 Tax=Corchorus olitorius TaxID=93759 RepID=A0A1R3G1J6_9ROSI|nr:hypothetical protein COLO4_37456 [Corchorus olitorius]
MGGNVSRGPLIPDLTTVLQDLASISIDLTLTESRSQLLISKSSRPSRLIFGDVLTRARWKNQKGKRAKGNVHGGERGLGCERVWSGIFLCSCLAKCSVREGVRWSECE